jgi:ketosteroid isomerase-like protein
VVQTVETTESLQLLAPDVELDMSELIDGRVYRGRDGACACWESLHEDVWAELRMETEAIEQHGSTVVALVNCHAVGKRSGVPVDFEAAWVATLDDGLVKTARFTLDRQAARESARRAPGFSLV